MDGPVREEPGLVVHVQGEPVGPWTDAFASAFPRWRVWDSGSVPAEAAEAVELAVVWGPPAGFFARFPRVRQIVSAGTGLDHLRHDPSRPAGVPVLRRRDPASTRTMAEFVLLQVLVHHRGLGACLLVDRHIRRWDPVTRGPLAGCRITVLGFGPMAVASAELLASFGCLVTAWSRSPRTHSAIEVRSGWDALDGVFQAADILVNLLPSTEETRGLIDGRRLDLMPRGAGFINVGRGDGVDQAALLQRLDTGRLSLASLDVLQVEPPPADDPVWSHPRVILTPHVASIPDPATFARWVASALDDQAVGPADALTRA